MKFKVHATITEIYYIEAESFDQALEIACERETPDETNSQGFSYVLNLETMRDLIL